MYFALVIAQPGWAVTLLSFYSTPEFTACQQFGVWWFVVDLFSF